MENIFYKVVFSGVIDPRKDRKDVVARFSRKSRLPLKIVDKMFSSDKAVTIRTDLSKGKAITLKAKLDEIGMRTAVVVVETSAVGSDIAESISEHPFVETDLLDERGA